MSKTISDPTSATTPDDRPQSGGDGSLDTRQESTPGKVKKPRLKRLKRQKAKSGPSAAEGPDGEAGIAPDAEAETRAARRQRWLVLLERAFSIILMLAGFTAIVLLAGQAVLTVFGPNPCVSGTCDYYQFTLGWILAMVGPVIAFVPAIIMSIMLMVQRRVSFWVPIVGFGFALLLWWGGISLVLANVSYT